MCRTAPKAVYSLILYSPGQPDDKMSWPSPPDFLDLNLALEDLVSASNAVAPSTSGNCDDDRLCFVRTGNHCLLFLEKKRSLRNSSS